MLPPPTEATVEALTRVPNAQYLITTAYGDVRDGRGRRTGQRRRFRSTGHIAHVPVSVLRGAVCLCEPGRSPPPHHKLPLSFSGLSGIEEQQKKRKMKKN